MGIESSCFPRQNQEDPLQQFKSWGLIHFPDEDEDEEDGGDIDEVMPGLFLGGMEGAMQHDELRRRGVTHVLNAASYNLSPSAYDPHAFRYLILCAEDTPSENLKRHFDKTTSFIASAMSSGAVYVHCYAGVSRGPSVVIAFLMMNMGMTFKDAYSVCKRARPQVFPNNGFVNQLMQLEEDLKHKPPQLATTAGRFSSSDAPASRLVPASSLHPIA
mmetsp:Transcript_26433/g.60171  ORF Transcript_26433/g.60171 Transcript_26433/m.60171 type:complete len:216 (-) Transcript_26433:3-650(-)